MEPDLNFPRLADPLSDQLDCLAYMMMHIDKLHYTYLHTHESLQKLVDKNRLEGHIKEYLMIAPHEKKFLYHETNLILHRSIQHKENFSGIRASAAWSSIAAYAHNLLAQSWRKEFREIQTHSGYYKHNVERGLIGSDIMLCLMGYRELANGVFILDGPVDPDRVANVSRDSLVAMVECQILCTIYADLLKRGCNVPWIEILEYREKHPCTADQALHELINLYQYNQRYLNTCQSDCYAKCSMPDRGIYNIPSYKMQNNAKMPYYNDAADGMPITGNRYPGNSRCHTCSTYLAPNPPPLRQNNACSVPIGQLIELDSSYSGKENYIYDSDNYQKTPSDNVDTCSSSLSDGNSNPVKYRVNKEFDLWGASYQPSEIKKNTKYDVVGSKKKIDDWEEQFKAFRLDEPQPSCSTSEPKPIEKPKGARKKIKLDSNSTSYGSVQTLGRDIVKKPDSGYMSLKVKLGDKWECPACTFHNSNDKDVCEMCSKSKNVGNEVQPLVSGGRQCPKCTLVNEKGVTVCEVCGENLKDSPTYI